jgi:hypothetical protein
MLTNFTFVEETSATLRQTSSMVQQNSGYTKQAVQFWNDR